MSEIEQQQVNEVIQPNEEKDEVKDREKNRIRAPSIYIYIIFYVL